jgi:general secretion pathway protein J
MAARRPSSSGLTVLEILIAVAIFAIVTTLLWGTLQGTLTAKRRVEATQDRYRSVRLALNRMARELSTAYLSTNEPLSAVERRTFLVGEDRGDTDRLRFSALAHVRLREGAHESDQSIIQYYLAPDRSDSTTGRHALHLWRRETRRLANEPVEKITGEAYVLCPDVSALQLSYYDPRNREWRSDWNTLALDGQANRLPTRVRISLSVLDPAGKTLQFLTATRLVLQEPFGT